MTALIAEPVAVFDVRDGTYEYTRHAELRRWAIAQRIDINNTFRIEIFPDTAKVHQYVRDQNGHIRLDPAANQAQHRVTEIPISSMPTVLPSRKAR